MLPLAKSKAGSNPPCYVILLMRKTMLEDKMLDFENATLSQKIAESIAAQIAEGALKPGERLLENELTQLFGTSRAPVREALFLLEKSGIVERIPRRGVFVKKYSQKELNDLYDIVYRLTEIALEKAMEHSDDSEIEDLSSLVSQMEATIEKREVKKCFTLLQSLHLKFFDLSGSEILKELYANLNSRLAPFRYLSLSHPTSLERSVAEYKEIIMGLKAKDIAQIRSALAKKEHRALAVLEKVISGESD
jgi:DNA-binding GntR family transcriptional regulator